MTRLIDRLTTYALEFSFKEVLSGRQFSDALADAKIIVLDNVAQYYYLGNPEGDIGLKDMPNAAPPFGSFFTEFRMPSQMNVGGSFEKTASDWIGSEIGVFFQVCEREDAIQVFGDVWESEGRWMMIGHLALYMMGELRFPVTLFAIQVDETGKIILTRQTEATTAGQWGPVKTHESYVNHFENIQAQVLAPMLLGISFMHCKNVKMVQEIPPAALSKKRQKKSGRPLERYHVLDIEPMKAVLRTQGQAGQTGLRNALHICRGHFKDYREHGLFGRNKGIYWWEDRVRGNHTEGVVVKDYAVKK